MRGLRAGLKMLRQDRDGKGRWQRFPFWYTVLALSESQQSAVTDELCYAATALERALRAKALGDTYTQRRRLLATRVLEMLP